MKIAVCIKQVPSSENVDVDRDRGILIRDNLENKMNPYDLHALELALRIAKEHDAEVSVISMGPPQATEIIKEAYAMGADKGYLLSDRNFAGSDVLATSYTLANGIKKIDNFDIILCGKLTIDGDTAQVGPELATILKVPHIISVQKVIEVENRSITVEREMNNGSEIAKISFPCLLTIDKNASEPRLPSYLKKKASKDREIKVFSLNDFEDKNKSNYGLEGSPTKVSNIFKEKMEKTIEVFNGDKEFLADKLSEKLKELKFI